MKCKICGKELRDGAKICGKCGTKIEDKGTESLTAEKNSNQCSVCGKELKTGVKFCSKCGAKVEQLLDSSEKQIIDDKRKDKTEKENSSFISIKISGGENGIANPFFLNGEDPCEAILHPKLSPLKKKKSITSEIRYKHLENIKQQEEERLRREAKEAEERRREEEERQRKEEEERLRGEAKEAEEAEERRRKVEEADRIYREEMDRKLAEIEPIQENIIPDEESIIHNAETELEKSSVPVQKQAYVTPAEAHAAAQQFRNGFRTERVEKLAKAKPRKL